MKNIFGINITNDKKNTSFDGQAFIVNSASPELEAELDAAAGLVKDAVKQSMLPLWMRIIKTGSGFLAFIIAAGIIGGAGLAPSAIAQSYSNAPQIFYATAILFIIWLALFIVAGIKRRNFEESYDYSEVAAIVETVADRMDEEFNIPPDAKNVDMLSFRYKIKNGKVKIVNSANDTAFMNYDSTVYIRDDALHIFLLTRMWVIPLQSIKEIRKINKKIFANGWNKETPSNKGEFKKYKIGFNCTNIFFKPYYDILIKHDKDDYCISIPPYELDTMSELIGIKTVSAFGKVN